MGEKSSTGTYETFDSADGPTIPSSAKKDFAHNDAAAALSDMGDEHGAVPEVPSNKK